jgi:peptide chain release factor 1
MIPVLKNRLEEILNQYSEIESKLLDSDININIRLNLTKEHSDLAPIITAINELQSCEKEMEGVQEILNDKDTDSLLREEALKELDNLKKTLQNFTQKTQKLLIPKDPDDNRNAIIEIRAGTGGDEAALFGSNLLKMYIRYAELQKWKIEILSLSENDIGGCKEASAKIIGNNVFGRLKFESGVHRVQRVPTTETQGRIHTSAATVAILPVVEEVDIEINNSELRIDTYRAQGAGGQHVNKTESAVRITHLPTGTVTQCQDGKSQHKNKAKALEMLRAKLYNNEKEIRDSERSEKRKSLVGSGDRSERIRTYNFPQDRITDHRIQLSLNRIEEILSGSRLNEIIDVLLAQEESDRLANLTE